ncbi:MAG: S24 family peptidase [Deltaproteobacteria bacterium]
MHIYQNPSIIEEERDHFFLDNRTIVLYVEKGREPKNGDIVIAEVDDEWTLKYFKRNEKAVVLEAANPRYPVIRAKSELRVGGVVTAVIRKYHR